MTGISNNEYDVIICGTDLIQSILSSALSRAGKNVLHCDGNEWYGGFDAVLYTGSTLDCFIEGCQEAIAHNSTEKNENKSCSISGEFSEEEVDDLELLPREKYADLKLHSQTFIPSVELPTSTIAETSPESDGLPTLKQEGSRSLKSHPDNATTTPESKDVQNTDSSFSNILEHNFSLDISPSLIYASGVAVQGLVKSGVADYLEFKSLQGLYLLMDRDESKKQRSTRRGDKTVDDVIKSTDGGRANNEADDILISYRVPCSKGDVFRSQLLSPIDKRRLMKFLQLISDYGLAQEDATSSEAGEDVASDVQVGQLDRTMEEPAGEDAMYSINERYLNRGRSLSRPQNKAKPSTSELDSLIRCIRDNIDFADFLSDVAKLPSRLCSVVTHALALASFGRSQSSHHYSTKNGVDDLLRHVSALGRFGDTAFLVPMYGSGELSQAFCRSGAVFGSTYMLRRSPLSISVESVSGDKKVVRAVTLSGEVHIGGLDDANTDDTSKKEVSCAHVIVPSTMIPRELFTSDSNRVRIYRRISILKGDLSSRQDTKGNADDKEQRFAVIIPPGARGLNNTSAVHGVVVDDSAFIAPARKGYTVLHLTTSVLENEDTPDTCFDILAKSVHVLIDSHSYEEDKAFECHHISFSYSTEIRATQTEKRKLKSMASGLHVCYRDTQSITCDYAFREAQRIFDEICPEADFLALAKEVEESIVYKNNDDSDDERMVLSNALDMIQDCEAGEVKSDETTDVLGVLESGMADSSIEEVLGEKIMVDKSSD